MSLATLGTVSEGPQLKMRRLKVKDAEKMETGNLHYGVIFLGGSWEEAITRWGEWISEGLFSLKWES